MRNCNPVPVPVKTSGPTFEPVTIEEAKAQVNIAESQPDWDDQLESLITVAREVVERDASMVIGNSTWTYTLDRWPAERYIRLPLRPVRSISSITYLDANGDAQTWDSDEYRFDEARVQPAIWLAESAASWPSTYGIESAITITLTAGYATQSAVPRLVKQLCLMQVAALFRNRETDGPAATAYDNLLRRVLRSTYP